MGFLIDWLSRAAQWLHDFIIWLPLHIWKLCLAGISDAINAIPVPGFFSNVAGYIGSVPPLVQYIMASLNFSAGLTIILTAYTLRFLLRRVFFLN